MKAALLKQYSKALVMEDVPVPCAGPQEVLVKLKACGICGTDLKVWAGAKEWVKLPAIMGHEIAGEIVGLGTEVHHLSVGERGVIHFFLTCGKCEFCLTGNETLCEHPMGKLGFNAPGGLAEYVVAPAGNFIPIPDGLPFAQAAIVCDAVATPYRALTKAAIQPGDCVLVMGLGGLGIHGIQIAKKLDANVVGIDIEPRKLELARELGIECLIRYQADTFIEDVRKAVNGQSIRAIFETVSTPSTVEADLELLGKKGRLILAGYTSASLRVPPLTVILKELSILGSIASSRKDVCAVLSLLANGAVKPIVSKTYSLDEVNSALEELKRGLCIGRQVITFE